MLGIRTAIKPNSWIVNSSFNRTYSVKVNFFRNEQFPVHNKQKFLLVNSFSTLSQSGKPHVNIGTIGM